MTELFFVSYRLPERTDGTKPNYDDVAKEISKLSAPGLSPVHPFDNAWFIESNKNAAQIKQTLANSPPLEQSDTLLVVQLSNLEKDPKYAHQNLEEEAAEILRHENSPPVPTMPLEVLEKEQNALFLVSCDQGREDTDRIRESLNIWAKEVGWATTSTWVLMKQKGQIKDLQSFMGRRMSGETYKMYVTQITCGLPSSKGPLVLPLGSIDKEHQKNLDSMLERHRA